MNELEPWQVSTKTAGNPRGISESEPNFWTHVFKHNVSKTESSYKLSCPLPPQGLGSPHKNKHLQRHKENERQDLCIMAFVFMKCGCEFCGLCRPFPAESYYVEPTRTDSEMPVGGYAFHVVLFFSTQKARCLPPDGGVQDPNILPCFPPLLHRFILLPKQFLILNTFWMLILCLDECWFYVWMNVNSTFGWTTLSQSMFPSLYLYVDISS